MQSLHFNHEEILNNKKKNENENESCSSDEEKKPRPKTQRGKTLRGAALNSNLNNDKESLKSSNVNTCAGEGGGIYASRINKTKQVGREIVKKINTEEDAKTINNSKKEKEGKENQKKQTRKVLVSSTENSDSDDSNSDVNTLTDSSSDGQKVTKRKKKPENKKHDKNSESISSSPDLPPPPSSARLNKSKRKSTGTIKKQLSDLDVFLKNNPSETNLNKKDDNSEILSGDDDDAEESENSLVTVRVSTRHGTKRWEIKKNETFQTVLDELAKIEKTNAENLMLMLSDKPINFYDTPLSINLRVTDILVVKVAKVAQERIKVIEDDGSENEDDDEKSKMSQSSSRLICIILQTSEGRKSRVKLQVTKDEQFKNILKKYCEVKGLDFAGGRFIMEFDGDLVESNETPTDLDLDGDEIFDVKQSSKPSSKHIEANKRNYEFDDDVIGV